MRFLDSFSLSPFWLPAPHVIPSFINVFDIVSDKSKLDKSLPQRRRHGGRLPSKISVALSSGRLGTCCDHCLFAGWLVSSRHSHRAGGKIWKSRGTLVKDMGHMQMVELLGLVAVGIHHKRHSAPRPLKIPGDTSLSLQQEEDEPEPLVMWLVAGASLSGGRE